MSFARPLKLCWGVAIVLAVVGAVGLSISLGFSLFYEQSWLSKGFKALPLPDLAVKLTAEALILGPAVVLPALVLVWLRTRFGAAEIGAGVVRFRPPLAGELVFPLNAVTERVVTSRGIRVRVPGRSTQARFLCPLVVPLSGEAQEAEVLRALEGAGAHEPYCRTPTSLAHDLSLIAAVTLPFVAQFTVVDAFWRMFAEVGIAATDLAQLLFRGRLLILSTALQVFAIAVGGTWAPRRVTALVWLAVALYVAVSTTALVQSMVVLTRPL